MRTRRAFPLVAGATGIAAVAVGYVLEAIRQRGSCDLGDKSPDTVALSVILIVGVGGMAGLTGIVVAAVHRLGSHGSRSRNTTIGLVLSAISLAGAMSIFLFAGRGPSTWFQYCGT